MVIHTRRRDLLRGALALAGLGVVAGCGVPFTPSAQPARLHRIGILASGTMSSNAPRLEAFRQGLRELGYVEGQNIAIEIRVDEGTREPLPELAAELVRRDVEAIVVSGSAELRAAQQATNTIPIVFAFVSDPVTNEFVVNLARPGGNTTGLTQDAGEESAKRLELLKEAFPGLSRVAAVWTTDTRRFKETEVAAQKLGLDVLSLRLEGAADLDTVLAAATTGRADGLIVVSGGARLNPLAPLIVEFAARNRLPAMYFLSSYADAGGLMFYGANAPDNFRRAATYVDKILKGARPGDLPVEQPTKFDFIVNLKTAQAIGLTIPQSVLAQATEIIR